VQKRVNGATANSSVNRTALVYEARSLIACPSMNELPPKSEPPSNIPQPEILDREAGLHRGLTSWQVAMIGLGSTIGTGLFLGSALSVKLAGPAVIVSFLLGAIVTVTVMWALAEMAAEHPAAGSFGLYAEMYVHPWAGFAIRYTYWLCLVFVVGSEVVAAAIYCKYWWPAVPSWMWIAGFSLALLYANTISIKSFGAFEYWFAMIKVVTIFAFLILGAALLFGAGFPRIGAANYTAHGGFFPNGWSGVGLGVTMAIFSFLGLEIVGATAGEAANPSVAVPRALRRTLSFLVLFYLGGLAVVVGIVPWKELGLGESPFVRVFRSVGIPGVGNVMNFVVFAFFTGARRLRSRDTRKIEQARNARCRSDGFRHRAAHRSFSLAFFRVHSVCVHDRRGLFWWPICLDHDPGNASGFSPRQRARRKINPPFCATWTVELALWPRRAGHGLDFHLVGARISHHHGRRSSVARDYDHLLFNLGSSSARKTKYLSPGADVECTANTKIS
jgi:hypothetical protein